MLFDVLLGIINFFIKLLYVLPDWSFDVETIDRVGLFIQYGLAFNDIFPMILMWKMIILILSFEVTLKGINLIWKLFGRQEYSSKDFDSNGDVYQVASNEVIYRPNPRKGSTPINGKIVGIPKQIIRFKRYKNV